jgi:CBS domain containing-hemolysin-like protein
VARRSRVRPKFVPRVVTQEPLLAVCVGLLGFFLSTALITLLGEICPQAAFTRHALSTWNTGLALLLHIPFSFSRSFQVRSPCLCVHVGAELGYRVVPLVRVIIFIFYPLAKPVAMTLDCLLGKELGTLYTKKEVCYLVTTSTADRHSCAHTHSAHAGSQTRRLSHSHKLLHGSFIAPHSHCPLLLFLVLLLLLLLLLLSSSLCV